MKKHKTWPGGVRNTPKRKSPSKQRRLARRARMRALWPQSKGELATLAKRHGVQVTTRMTKGDLAWAIIEKEGLL